MDIIHITLEDSANVNALISANKELFSRIPYTLDYVCKYFAQNQTIVMKCKWGTKGIDMDVHQENSMLIVKKPIPSFHICATVKDGHFQLKNISSSKEAIIWLNRRNSQRSNAEELWYVAMHSAVALSSCKPVLMHKETADGAEYWFPNNFQSIAKAYFVEQMKKEINEKKFDGYDIVNLTFKQYIKMLDIINNHKINRDIDNFALPRFAVSLFEGESHQYYFYEAKGRDIHCGYSNDKSKNVFWFDARFESANNEADTVDVTLRNSDKVHPWFLQSEAENDNEHNWEWCVNLFLLVNAFMLHYGDVAMEIEEKQAKAPTESRPQKKRDRNSVRIFKSYHLVKNWTTKARKKAEFTCLAWGVRGHFRHLRNGKTIFVEAYVKGKEKDKYKGKEYNLLPYKDA